MTGARLRGATLAGTDTYSLVPCASAQKLCRGGPGTSRLQALLLRGCWLRLDSVGMRAPEFNEPLYKGALMLGCRVGGVKQDEDSDEPALSDTVAGGSG